MCEFPPFISNVNFTEFLPRLVFQKVSLSHCLLNARTETSYFKPNYIIIDIYIIYGDLDRAVLKYFFYIYEHVIRAFTACSGVANPKCLST